MKNAPKVGINKELYEGLNCVLVTHGHKPGVKASGNILLTNTPSIAG